MTQQNSDIKEEFEKTERFLYQLGFDELKGFIELRFIKNTSVVGQRFFKSLDKVNWEEIKAQNQKGIDIYFGVCPRREKKGNKETVCVVPAFFVDIDGKNFKDGKAEAFKQLDKLPSSLYPSIVVDSGHGFHCYWVLEKKPVIDNSDDFPQIEGYLKGLSLWLNGDKTYDLSRVLRLPGTLNWKNPKEPVLCQLMQFTPKLFREEDFELIREDVREDVGEVQQENKFFKGGEVEVELDDLNVSKHTKDLIIHGNTQKRYRSRSEADEAVITSLLKGGHDANTIRSVFRNESWKIGEKYHEKEKYSDTYLQTSIIKATKYIEKSKRNTQSTTKRAKRTGKEEVNCPQLAKEIMEDYHFKTLKDTEEVLIYDKGFYKYEGEAKVKEEVGIRLKDLTTTHRINEVLQFIKVSTYVDRKEFNKRQEVINVKNGVLNLETGQLKPHSPKYLFTYQIPVYYDPNISCPKIKKFFEEVVSLEDIPLMGELFGHCLEMSYWSHRGFLFIGDGYNGKSTMLNLLREFLGRDNCVSAAIQELEINKYAVGELCGKLANIYADLPTTTMKHVSYFKMLTGEDLVYAEHKFKNPFNFINYAKLIFSANKPPQVLGEDTKAFWSRWIIVNFPNEFPPDDPKTNRNLLEELTSANELSGLLNLALDDLRRLHQNWKFSYSKTIEQIATQYLRAADPIYAFIEDKCVNDPEAWTSKEELFGAYKKYCKEQKIPVMNIEAFGRAFKRNTQINAKTQRSGTDKREWGWQGIKLEESNV